MCTGMKHILVCTNINDIDLDGYWIVPVPILYDRMRIAILSWHKIVNFHKCSHVMSLIINVIIPWDATISTVYITFIMIILLTMCP